MATPVYRFDVHVSNSENGKVVPLLNFVTDRLGITPAEARSFASVKDEASARAMLGKIMAHNQLSIGVEDGDPRLIHKFHLIPLDQPVLEVTINLIGITPKYERLGPHPSLDAILAQNTQNVASLTLPKVRLLGFPASKDEEVYTAILKVTGKSQLADSSKGDN
jgi:hypothetical protein